MKKLLALALTLVLLCMPLAMAESTQNNAAILILSNMNIMGNSTGDLELWLGMEAMDAPTFICAATADCENSLVYAIGQIVDDQFRFMFDGEDVAYAQNLKELIQSGQVPAEMQAQVTELLEQLPEVMKQLIPALDELVLPAIPAVAIPKLDLTSLVSLISADGQTFEFTTEQVDSMLDMLASNADALSSQVPQISQLVELLPQIKGKLAVNGSVADEGGAQVARANIVVEGQTVATLVLTSQDNNVRLGVESEGSELLGIAAASNPGANRMDLTFEFMGTRVGGLAIYQEDGLQKIAVDVSASGESIALEFDYGSQNGTDVVELSFAGDSVGKFLFNMSTVKEGDVRYGTLTIENSIDTPMTITADVTMYLADSLGTGEITWPANLLPLSQIDPQSALQPVADYLQTLQADAA